MSLEAIKALIDQAEIQVAEHAASKEALAVANIDLTVIAEKLASAQAIVSEKQGIVAKEQSDVVAAIQEIIARSQEVLAQLG